MIHTEYIIVGQGLAGTLLAYSLHQSGKEFLVVDPGAHSASSIAAGIINPVTGKKLVKSWRFEDFLPKAIQVYKELESFLGISIIQSRKILSAITRNDEANQWLLRSTYPEYENYLHPNGDPGDWSDFLEKPLAWGKIHPAFQIDLPHLVNSFQGWLLTQGKIIQEYFDYSLIEFKGDGIKYKEVLTKKVIFCEGAGFSKNPYFNFLPGKPAKGEVLILDFQDPVPKDIIKWGLFLVPLGKNKVWAGSNYDWTYKNAEPSYEGKEELMKKLKKILIAPFEIQDHLAAIRPAIRDRRPVMGMHPKFQTLGIFNGFGTKGASLGPYWAAHFEKYLSGSKENLDKEVDLNRFL